VFYIDIFFSLFLYFFLYNAIRNCQNYLYHVLRDIYIYIGILKLIKYFQQSAPFDLLPYALFISMVISPYHIFKNIVKYLAKSQFNL
jgi:hypothetical protein